MNRHYSGFTHRYNIVWMTMQSQVSTVIAWHLSGLERTRCFLSQFVALTWWIDSWISSILALFLHIFYYFTNNTRKMLPEYQDAILFAATPGGFCVGIKIFPQSTLFTASEMDTEQQSIANAIALKDAIECGSCDIANNDQIILNPCITTAYAESTVRNQLHRESLPIFRTEYRLLFFMLIRFFARE